MTPKDQGPRPKRWRYRLFGALALLWGLLLLQALFPPGEEARADWISPASALWLVVEVALIALTWIEWRRREQIAR